MNVGEIVLFVVVLADSNRIAAGQKSGTGCATERLAVEIGEPHPLTSHLIDPRSLEVGRPKNAQVAVALVVGEDDDEVRLIPGLLRRR